MRVDSMAAIGDGQQQALGEPVNYQTLLEIVKSIL